MSNNNEKMVLPRPTPEIVNDVFGDQKNADSDGQADDPFEDLVIEIDEGEVEAEKDNNPSGRKY
jgi:hypothetical protein